jgi:hypothetical protein
MKMIFKNYMVLRIAVVFWSLSVLFVGIVHAQLSNQSLKGLKAKTIDEVLALPDSEIDLSTAILLINKKVSKALYQTDIEIENYIDKLDDIAVAISRKIENQKDPEKIVKIINSYFFQELNFSFVIIPGDYKSHLLSSVIDRKKGYCLTLSIVYLSIAERLGLPFYGGHDGLLLVSGLVVLLTIPDCLSCPLFILLVHFEVEFTCNQTKNT